MLCLQSFYYIRIRTSGTSVLKEALAIALPSRTNRLLESMHQDPQEVLQVSRSARVNCAVHVSRDFLFHALMGFFCFVDSDLISNSSYCLPYSSGDVGLENLVWNKLVAGSLCLQCLNVHGKCFSLKVRIQKFLKLIEISWLQEMKNKLTNSYLNYSLTFVTQTCQLCVSTIVKVFVMKNIS